MPCADIRRKWLELGQVLCVLLICLGVAPPLPAQIGGKTAADGPFTLDDVEDLDYLADGVERYWIPDFVPGVEEPFAAVNPAAEGLTLASGQSPNGCFRFTAPTSYGYLSKNFGVPVPGVAGASSLTSPGNITSFTHLTFLACFTTTLPDQEFQVILETYPGPSYPRLYYKYTPTAGTAFQPVSLDLRSPDLVQNAGSLTIDELLAQTRYLNFYFYGGPTTIPKTFVFHVDDIRLVAPTRPEPLARLADQQPVRVRAAGTAYQELFYNYSTTELVITPYSEMDAAVPFPMPPGQWTGIYHYDYGTGRFSQAVYRYRDSL